MLNSSVKIRKTLGKKNRNLRRQGFLPAVLYGPKIKESLSLEVEAKQFEAILKEAGQSALISLEIEGKKEKPMVLIHDFEKDPVSGKTTHVDFYQPNLKEEIEVKISLVFEGEAPAVKDLGGTLVKSLSEISVKAKPENLPREIKVNIEKLKTFQDNILLGDLLLPEGVSVLRDKQDIVVSVLAPEKIEEVKPEKAEVTATAAPEAELVSETKNKTKKEENVAKAGR